MQKKILSLELLRFIAAIWVLLAHFGLVFLEVNSLTLPLKPFTSTAELAVMVFFILSGFVIGRRHLQAGDPWQGYIRARLLRIYPIYLLVLLTTTALCFIPHYPFRANLSDFVGNIFQLQGAGKFRANPWALNDPLWTLSMEWWFYTLFVLIRFRLPLQKLSLSVFSLSFIATIAMYKYDFWAVEILSLFGIWWVGVVFASHQKLRIDGYALAYLSISALVEVVLKRQGGGLTWPSMYIFGILAYWLFIALGNTFEWTPSASPAKSITVLGGASYAIYLTHFPILVALQTVGVEKSVGALLLVLSGTIALGILLENYHKGVVKLFRR